MPAPALICDTGGLLEYLSVRAPHHRAFRSAIDAARTRYVPALVLAELDYFLRADRQVMRAFMGEFERGGFTYAPPTVESLERAMFIDRRYASLQLGLVDASIIALAEDLSITRIATRDVRHFSAVRLSRGRAFELVVVPRDAE